ncbi:hypothetical protein PSTT_00367 [Puccinia striiformis]|uniref:Uncharacterized protein n=1 Tax=Puccinia striiformis TaxID=27350 RepID=A0A2S4W774_9BASI|nr:hypothetical protein PSTT_00367 [Puccinia striiformis]
MSGSGPPSPHHPHYSVRSGWKLNWHHWIGVWLLMSRNRRPREAHRPNCNLSARISRSFEDNYNDIESWMTLSISPSIAPSSSWTLLADLTKFKHTMRRIWKMLTGETSHTFWLSRENLIRSCIDVVDRSVQERNDAIHRLSMDPTDPKNVPPLSSSKTKSQLEAEVYNAELKRRMIHDELTVESTIRKQTIQKFRTRCPESFFSIPTDSPPTQLDPHPSSTSPAQ